MFVLNWGTQYKMTLYIEKKKKCATKYCFMFNDLFSNFFVLNLNTITQKNIKIQLHNKQIFSKCQARAEYDRYRTILRHSVYL